MWLTGCGQLFRAGHCEGNDPVAFDHMSAETSAVCCYSCWGEPHAAFGNCSVLTDGDIAIPFVTYGVWMFWRVTTALQHQMFIVWLCLPFAGHFATAAQRNTYLHFIYCHFIFIYLLVSYCDIVHIVFSEDGLCDFYVNVQMIDNQAVLMYGAPATMWIRYTVRPTGTTVAGRYMVYDS